MKICFLTKIEKSGVKEAISFTENITKGIDIFHGDTDNPLPEKITRENYDLLISYISPWIIPKTVLDKTKKWNINLTKSFIFYKS